MLTDDELQSILQDVKASYQHPRLTWNGKPLQIVGEGSTRTAYAVPGTDVVFKLTFSSHPVWRDGCPSSNVGEWMAWHTYISKRAATYRQLFSECGQLALFPRVEGYYPTRTVAPHVVVQQRVNDGGQGCAQMRNSLNWRAYMAQVAGNCQWLTDFHDKQFVYDAATHTYKLVDYDPCVGEMPMYAQRAIDRLCSGRAYQAWERLAETEKPLVIEGVDKLRIMLNRSWV